MEVGLMAECTTLIIDIRKSRRYDKKKRSELQQYLLEIVKKLNLIFEKDLIFKVTFSAGDELQGLFENTLAALMYLRLLEIMVFPVQIRAGIGVGEWTIKVMDGESTEQDGPTYHRARQAVEEVYNMQTQRFRINSNREKDIQANYLLNVSWGYLMDQNDNQNMIQLISEILYPFVSSKESNKYGQTASDILAIKNQYGIRKSKTYQSSQMFLEYADIQEPILVADKLSQEPENSIIKKNISTNISKVVGRTRQNIDTIMKRGNIIPIRTMDYMALHYIRKCYGGRNDI